MKFNRVGSGYINPFAYISEAEYNHIYHSVYDVKRFDSNGRPVCNATHDRYCEQEFREKIQNAVENKRIQIRRGGR